MELDRRTFVDAGILIAAARGISPKSFPALALLDEENREFISSPFIRLEVFPKAAYYRKRNETAFYEAFFESVTHWVEASSGLLQDAEAVAARYGLGALDALHIAAALAAGAEEFITTEKPNKPIHRVVQLKIITL